MRSRGSGVGGRFDWSWVFYVSFPASQDERCGCCLREVRVRLDASNDKLWPGPACAAENDSLTEDRVGQETKVHTATGILTRRDSTRNVRDSRPGKTDGKYSRSTASRIDRGEKNNAAMRMIALRIAMYPASLTDVVRPMMNSYYYQEHERWPIPTIPRGRRGEIKHVHRNRHPDYGLTTPKR